VVSTSTGLASMTRKSGPVCAWDTTGPAKSTARGSQGGVSGGESGRGGPRPARKPGSGGLVGAEEGGAFERRGLQLRALVWARIGRGRDREGRAAYDDDPGEGGDENLFLLLLHLGSPRLRALG